MPADPPNDRGRVSDRLSVMCGPATEDRVDQVEFHEVRLDYTIPASRRFLSRTNRWSLGTGPSSMPLVEHANRRGTALVKLTRRSP
jgi:hypothetical protein